MSRDWGLEAHAAAEAHLDLVQQWMDYYDDGETPGGRPAQDDPAAGPFCGCETCIIREVLYAAWPIIEEATLAGERFHGEDPEQGGPWTSHGHEVQGITVAGPGRPAVARCGGPGLCPECSREAAVLQARRRAGTG